MGMTITMPIEQYKLMEQHMQELREAEIKMREGYTFITNECGHYKWLAPKDVAEHLEKKHQEVRELRRMLGRAEDQIRRLKWAEEDVTKLRDVKDSHDRLQNKVDAFNKLPWWKRPFINI